MCSDIAIQVEDLSKCYHVYPTPTDRLMQAGFPRAALLARGLGLRTLSSKLAEKKTFSEFWALRSMSFEVKRGETVGIVGRNGSGKSTLLQIIAGTLTPTTGTVRASGRLAALLELGSGFNPEFTGIENVMLNATVLGLSPAEIDSRMDAILAFADIGDFVRRPVKTYSSGMVVRLAFAVQAQVEPDILIVDEALAVGDAKFQAKCFSRLESLKQSGTSILFVSHSTEQVVTHCDRAILLSNGELLEDGQPKDVVHTYLELLFGASRRLADPTGPTGSLPRPDGNPVNSEVETRGNAFSARPSYNAYEFRWGDGAAAIADYCLATASGTFPNSVTSGERVSLKVGLCFIKPVRRPILGITIKTKEGITVFGTNSELLEATEVNTLGNEHSEAVATLEFACNLAPGDYFISLGLASRDGDEVVPHDRRYDSIHLNVTGEGFFGLAMLNMTLHAKECAL